MRLLFILLLLFAQPYTLAAEAINKFQVIPGSDGVPINVVESGNPSGQPIVFIHGFSQSYQVWREQLHDDALRERYRLIAIDLRGHGASGKPWNESAYTGYQSWARDIRAVMDALHLSRPVLVGWSFGGYVALDYVREYGAASLGAIVLAGSHAGLIDRPPGGGAEVSNDLDRLVADGRAFVALMTASPMTPQVSESMLHAYLMLPPYVRRAMGKKRLNNKDLADQLDLPILLILGEKDASVPIEPVSAVLSANSKASIKKYAGVGHSSFIEAPAKFNHDLDAFVKAAMSAPPQTEPASMSSTPIPKAVTDYLAAVNAGDSVAAVASFAASGEMHLLQGRVARGYAELLEIERFHETARPRMQPVGLRVTRVEGGEIAIGFDTNIESSAVFSAIGLERVRATGLTEAFVVKDGKIKIARQPEFLQPCTRIITSAMSAATEWLRQRRDARSDFLMPEGKIRMDALTVSGWIFAIRDWRASTGWVPDRGDHDACANPN